MIRTMIVTALLSGAAVSFVRADVVDTSATGFTVKNVLTVDADAKEVYDRLVGDVGTWWESDHTWSGDAANLSIEARAGGLFRERLPSGGSVTHLEVVFAERGSMLRMRGGLGPLQGMAVTGSLTWQMEESDGRTTITQTYAVTGYAPGGLAALAKPVDFVLGTQLMRLKRFIETGSPWE